MVAIYSTLDSESERAIVNFYKIIKVAISDEQKTDPAFQVTSKVFEYDKPLMVDSPAILYSTNFIKSDFAYVPSDT